MMERSDHTINICRALFLKIIFPQHKIIIINFLQKIKVFKLQAFLKKVNLQSLCNLQRVIFSQIQNRALQFGIFNMEGRFSSNKGPRVTQKTTQMRNMLTITKNTNLLKTHQTIIM